MVDADTPRALAFIMTTILILGDGSVAVVVVVVEVVNVPRTSCVSSTVMVVARAIFERVLPLIDVEASIVCSVSSFVACV